MKLALLAKSTKGSSWFNADLLLLGGALLGAGIATRQTTGTWRLRAPRRDRLPAAIGGGILMGFGATIGPGCNIGVLLGALPALSLQAAITSVAMVASFALVTLGLARSVARS